MRFDERTLLAAALCLLVLSLGATPALAAASVDGDTTGGSTAEVGSLTAVDATDTAADNDTNTSDSPTDGVTDTVNDTADDTTDTVDNTTDDTTDTVDDTTNETTDGTTDTVDDTTDGTTDTVDNTTEDATDTVDDTTDDATDTVDDTSGEATEAVENTTGGVELSTNDSERSPGSEGSGNDGSVESELRDVSDALTAGLSATTGTALGGVSETVSTLDDVALAVETTVVPSGGATIPIGTPRLDGRRDTSGTATGPSGEPPADANGDGAASIAEPLAEPDGGDGDAGVLALPASRRLPESVPVSGETAAVGVAVGAAAAAGTLVLRGSTLTGTGAGTGVGRAVVHGGRAAARRAKGWALERLLRIATLLRSTNYGDAEPLEHEARSAVFDAVEADPGRPITEVAEDAGVNVSTARYHVRVLQEADLLMRAKVRGRQRLFPAFTDNPELLAALSDEATAPIVEALEQLGTADVRTLAEELDKAPSTITHHLQRLEEDGVVVRERDGQSIVSRLDETARAALAPDADSDPDAAAAEPQRAD